MNSSIRRIGGVLMIGILTGMLLAAPSRAQDLEPRSLASAPVGMNFVLVGYGYSVGNVLLDSSLPLEGTEAEMNSISAAFARSIDFFGLSGRVSAAIPLAHATWSGELAGTDTSTTRRGFGDPVIALAVNFIGAPALRAADLATRRPGTVVGASLGVRVPIGQYNDQRYFNLSSGRWQFRPRLGISQPLGRFRLEGYASAWFFTTNGDFYGGNVVEQDPLFAIQAHLTYTFGRGFWGAVSFGQSFGGKVTANGVHNDQAQQNSRIGATLAVPLGRGHSLKALYVSGISTRAGADFDTIGLAWQYRWGGM